MFSGVFPASLVNPEFRGTTGRIFQEEVLGSCVVRAHGKMKFYASLKEVLANQPANTFKQNTEAHRFYTAVYNRVRDVGLDPKKLQVRSAIGSNLDWHGVDGVFTYEGIIVTVDCTINPHKDSTKARVLVTGDDLLTGYKDSASEIAFHFKKARQFGWKGVV